MARNLKKEAETKKALEGRPTKYRKKYCKQVIVLGKLGYLTASMAEEFGVAKSTLQYWAATIPDFSSAFDRARTCSEAYYEKKTMEATTPTEFKRGRWAAVGYFGVRENTGVDIVQNITQSNTVEAVVDFADREELEEPGTDASGGLREPGTDASGEPREPREPGTDATKN